MAERMQFDSRLFGLLGLGTLKYTNQRAVFFCLRTSTNQIVGLTSVGLEANATSQTVKIAKQFVYGINSVWTEGS